MEEPVESYFPIMNISLKLIWFNDNNSVCGGWKDAYEKIFEKNT